MEDDVKSLSAFAYTFLRHKQTPDSIIFPFHSPLKSNRYNYVQSVCDF